MNDLRNDDPNFDVMGNFDHGLTLALSKGRILKETLPLLENAGINLLEDPDKSRKLIFPTTHKKVRILIYVLLMCPHMWKTVQQILVSRVKMY